MYKKCSYFLLPSILILVPICMLMPEISSGGMILGHDVVFHYNRFYDALMQLKEGNLYYIPSLYGFQQSGRIVNAFYGPAFANFQAMLLFLTGTWYRYYLLSNIILSLIATSSFYYLSRVSGVSQSIALPLSILLVTTYSYQYWWINQGLTSWALALFPLCLIEAVKILKTEQIRPIPLVLSISLILQIHVLSAIFLALSYSIIIMYSFFKADNNRLRINLFLNSVKAFIIFILVNANIWYTYLEVVALNDLVDPFVNKNFVNSTITGKNSSVMKFPFFFQYFTVLTGSLGILLWKKVDKVAHIMFSLFLLFVVLATNITPWNWVVGKNIRIIELIQFPFRFYLYSVLFLVLFLGLLMQNMKNEKLVTIAMWLTCVMAIVGTMYEHDELLQDKYFSNSFLSSMTNSRVTENKKQLRSSLHSEDLSEFLKLVQKSTPDYLPQYKDSVIDRNTSNYKSYMQYVVENNEKYEKKVSGNKLIVEWDSRIDQKDILPIIIYSDSKLLVNGKEIKIYEKNLTRIGTPQIQSKQGKNEAILTYEGGEKMALAYIVSIFGLLIAFVYYFKFRMLS